jgi:hypothetical protein
MKRPCRDLFEKYLASICAEYFPFYFLQAVLAVSTREISLAVSPIKSDSAEIFFFPLFILVEGF